MAVFLPFVPNWRNGIRDTYEFKTDVFTTRNGSEQRRATRINPRRALEVNVLLDGERMRGFADAVNRAKDGKVEIADFSAVPALVATTASSGATVLTIDSTPSWMTNGGTYVLMTGRTTSKINVDFVDNNTVILVNPLTKSVGAGACILPMLPAQIANSNTLSLYTNQVATAPLQFDVEPGFVVRTPDALPFDESAEGDSVQSFGPAAVLFGRYVLLRKPNFLNRPQVQFNLKFETVDYSRGVVKTFTPVPIVSRTLTATYMAVNHAEAMAVLDIFMRCKGRAGEIYVPTWGSDFPPVMNVADKIVQVAGTDFYETYNEDRAHSAVLIRTKSGTLLPREINIMAASGGNTFIEFHEDVGVSATEIEQISWMFVSRFAQDSLTIEWVTNTVANISLSFVTLENLAAESSYGSNWILATGYWRDRGQWVDSAVWED
ncbi:hypothetical protein EM858_14625 [Agrobacterium sp. CNPSo 2736]|uniref:hypothetical protein n=1 Tax=Agrobacterium sp. CNPSo 2736 TaxID=2499627 RepID=UPI000FDB2768|nr:hypothetical protein [Agrobacterium sp. CNPSo 2736]RVT75678.1 hypothetical protein EM858_14625 [Agrobacterium sp. CNPSo 2736]